MRISSTYINTMHIHYETNDFDSIYTYLVEQFLEFFILSYLKVYFLQESSAKGTAVTSALEKLMLFDNFVAR